MMQILNFPGSVRELEGPDRLDLPPHPVTVESEGWQESTSENVPSRKLRWNLKMMLLNRNLLFQGAPIFRWTMLVFGGCNSQTSKVDSPSCRIFLHGYFETTTGGGFKDLLFSSLGNDPIWRFAYFSNGMVKNHQLVQHSTATGSQYEAVIPSFSLKLPFFCIRSWWKMWMFILNCFSWDGQKPCLGGGFKHFLFSPLFGEDFQFD